MMKDKVMILRHLYAMVDAINTVKHHSMMLGKVFDEPLPADGFAVLDSANKEIMRMILMIVEPDPVGDREKHIAAIFEAAMRRGSGATEI